MVGEGIETCLAAMQATGHPAWAALSTAGLRALDLPQDVRDVIVLADGDAARRGGRARLCLALEAAGPARAHRPSAAGNGLQRHAGAPRGGRAMTDHEHNTAEETITETIDGAEEVRDPLEGLVEKTRIDPGAPFTPEVLERLAALKKDDRAAFERLRAQLKAAGCRVTALDEALAEESW